MNERQKEAAERALRKIEMDDLIKRITLRRRDKCIADVSFYLLPFRVLYSLKQPREQIKLNRFFPYRACRKETEEKLRAALQMEREQTGELSEERIKEVQERIESIDYTPENMREYYFTCFLSGWDFSSFRIWDWTGDKIPQTEVYRLQEHYQQRQHDFLENPEKYAVPALIKDDDMGRYSPERQELLTVFDDLPD